MGKDKVPLQERPEKKAPRAQPPTANTIRSDRAKRADDARDKGPTQPTPLTVYDYGTLTSTRRLCAPTALLSPIGVCVDITETEDIAIARPPLVFELLGNSELNPDPSARDQIWPFPDIPRPIPVRFGPHAAGNINVYRDGSDKLHTFDVPGPPQLLPFFHDAFPRIHEREQPALLINIKDNVVTGRLVMTTMGSPLGYITPANTIDDTNVGHALGLEDLQELSATVEVNELANGQLTFYSMLDTFLLDGVFPQSDTKASYLHVINGGKTFELWSDIAAKGVDKTPAQIKRDPLGGLFGKLPKLHGKLEPKKGHVIEGDLEATFARGKFDIHGTLKYTSTKPKITGEVFLQVTDYATARTAAAQKLGDLAPPEYALEEVPNGLAMWGWGSLEFAFNEWFTGRAEVVVDPDGFITTRGHLAPTKVFTLFEKRTAEHPSYEDGHSVPFVIPPGIPCTAHAKLKVSFFTEVGPVLLGDIVVEGVYSTRPGITRRLSLAGTLGGRVAAGYKVKLTATVSGAGLLHAGIRFQGTAAMEGKLAMRPRIGWIGRGRTDVDDDPTSGKYYIQGRAGVDGAVVLGVTIDVFGKLGLDTIEVPSWVPFAGGKKIDLNVEASKRVLGPKTWRWSVLKLAWDFNHEIGKTGKKPDKVTRQDDMEHDWTLIDKMLNDRLPSVGAADEPVGTYTDFVRDEEMLTTETPPQPALGEVETSTPTIAGGNVEGDEFEAPPEGPTPTPPSTTPPTTPPTPTPTTPPTTPDPGAPDPGTAITAPDPTPAPEPAPPPPPKPPAAGDDLFAPPKSDDLTDLVITFQMEDHWHTLYLNRSTEPGEIRMASPKDELLAKQLRVALLAIRNQVLAAKGDGTVDGRSLEDLEDEANTLESLLREVAKVKDTALSLGPKLGDSAVGGVAKPIPKHVPGFAPLADHIQGYADEFDRTDLPEVTRTVATPPPRHPRLVGKSTPRLDQLEAASEGHTDRYIKEYDLYVGNCAASVPVRIPQEFVAYLERRAARKLGNFIEKPAIDAYNKLTGRSVAKNTREVELVNRHTGSVRKPASPTGRDRSEPDFFVPGKVLGDIKHVKKQNRTPQMEDFAEICKSSDKDPEGDWDARFKGETTLLPSTPIFDLVVRDATHRHLATHVTDPLRELIRERGGMVRHLIDDEVEGRNDDDE